MLRKSQLLELHSRINYSSHLPILIPTLLALQMLNLQTAIVCFFPLNYTIIHRLIFHKLSVQMPILVTIKVLGENATYKHGWRVMTLSHLRVTSLVTTILSGLELTATATHGTSSLRTKLYLVSKLALTRMFIPLNWIEVLLTSKNANERLNVLPMKLSE